MEAPPSPLSSRPKLRTRISYFALLARSTCAALLKESRLQINQRHDRRSGEERSGEICGFCPRDFSRTSADLENILVLCRLHERPLRNFAGYLEKLPCMLIPLPGQHNRQAMVSSVTDFRIQFDRPQERQVGLLSQ